MLENVKNIQFGRHLNQLQLTFNYFVNAPPPFKGETEQDLWEYLNDYVFYNEDFYNNESNIKLYSSDQLYQLSLEECYPMKVYSDSTNNGSDHLLDVGDPNEDFSRMGNFEVKATNFS